MKFECLRCLECCKRYWISLLPLEARAIAKHLKLSEKAFLKNYCVLLLQAFPFDKSTGTFVHSLNDFPSGIQAKLKQKTSASYFLVMPLIALKKEKNSCILLKDAKCIAYSSRPRQCRLFPLISLHDDKIASANYSFCLGLKG
ncbi:YkgJ family cysteine cluster protein, partial [archaeon]|nr:YkgJ family cysteine cluster protein [archaeon]